MKKQMIAVFFAGVVVGSALSIIILYAFGRRHAQKAIDRVDSQVKNVLLNSLNN